MKITRNAGGQPPSAGTSCANFLRTVLKRIVMWFAVRELISVATVSSVFARFDLAGA